MMSVFPVAEGPSTPVDFHQRFSVDHPGTDVFAPAGAQVLAVADGKIRHATEPRGGKVVYLTEKDGTQYFYGHLDQFAHRMAPTETRQVRAGEVLGYVGATGSAKGTPPHIHFEWRPSGGTKSDPFPVLTRLHAAMRASRTAKKARSSKARFPFPAKNPSRGGSGAGASGLGWLLALYVLFGRKSL
jgi:murein DD-endopeptidase MepM/ murein hydrolase activator NlpD